MRHILSWLLAPLMALSLLSSCSADTRTKNVLNEEVVLSDSTVLRGNTDPMGLEDPYKQILFGKVKSIKGNYFAAVVKNGQLIKASRGAHGQFHMSFNTNGTIAVEKSFRPDSSSGGTKKVFVYKIGNLVELKDCLIDGFVRSRTTFQYDSHGNRTGEKTFDYSGELTSECTYIYDEKGRKTEDHLTVIGTGRSNGDTITRTKRTFTYNEKGQLIAENNYSSEGSLRAKTSYTYDDKGNETAESVYSADGLLRNSWTFAFDDKGNVTEWNTYRNIRYSKDTKEIFQSKELTGTYRTEYEYDINGNWIRKVGKSEGKPQNITERTIEYYP